jgi:hypothetical protein
MQEQLYQSIIDVLNFYKKSENDILWVGTENGDYAMLWSDFAPIAKEITFWRVSEGAPEIDKDLVVVGEDWWLERRYDQYTEWWEFKAAPKIKVLHPFSFKKDEYYYQMVKEK